MVSSTYPGNMPACASTCQPKLWLPDAETNLKYSKQEPHAEGLTEVVHESRAERQEAEEESNQGKPDRGTKVFARHNARNLEENVAVCGCLTLYVVSHCE